MVKSSRSHYASHCIALHYDNGDNDGINNYDDCVALGTDDDDDDDGENYNNLPSPYILICFYIFP